MITPMNRATPEQISHYFGGRGVKKTPKKLVPKVPFTFSQGANGAYFELPIETHSSQRSAHPNPKFAFGQAHKARRIASEQVTITVAALQKCLRRLDRTRITHIALTRFSPGKLDEQENLPQSFKHVLDAVCAWIVRGDEFNEKDRRGIGKFDDQVLATGKGKVTCEYAQQKYDPDRTLRGIAILLRLG